MLPRLIPTAIPAAHWPSLEEEAARESLTGVEEGLSRRRADC